MDECHESRNPNGLGGAMGRGVEAAAVSTPGTGGDPARDAEEPYTLTTADEPEVYPDDADYEPL
ncbi:hypothetical protein ABNF97_06090 [Plantactinospora sp. B6F1]|uniref:hypothetical protein n=1 Tax=Plantactinospora sp. B6F1 TaxID=3158971 RepID=UPI0032D919DE